ncbi:MAG: FKBP-type peptidyl-prolyl cis-trans isomerase [Bacteroidota bacterium]
MKSITTIVIALVLAMSVISCKTTKNTCNTKPELKTNLDTISYIIGADIGMNLKKNGIEVNNDIFQAAFMAGIKGNDSLFSPAQKQKIMDQFQQDMQKKIQLKNSEAAEVNKKEGTKFLEENKTKPGVITTASGLQYKIIKEGEGISPNGDNTVKVNYEGKLVNGKKFDSSYDRGEPAEFPVNGVIKGWTEALLLMKPGAIWELYIPYDLAYGEQGYMDIPPAATLIFKVELISVTSKKQ